MKFLVDAQLPRRLCAVLAGRGHDAIHTLDLPDSNAIKYLQNHSLVKLTVFLTRQVVLDTDAPSMPE